ncbi:MAG: hypothetical protein HRT58_00080 [Crocinitomicaceae bacterium]|nr:hypothetical protein [Flavobacteriales bacterium]NQZ34017.1 hypothetical protein [Crocinitomicaceae bacterium]
MNFVNTFNTKMLLAFTILFSINANCQGSFEELSDNSESTIIVYKVTIDQKYISWVNNSKKLSSEEKTNKISKHKEEINEYNDNLEEAIDTWNGNNTFLVADTSNIEYIKFIYLLEEAKKNGEDDAKMYMIQYNSTPLLGETKKFKDPIFGGTHRPSLILVETNLSSGNAIMVTSLLVSQGVLSSGLLKVYLNAICAQKNDIDDGITWKNEKIYLERMDELKNKTLLIPEEFLNKRLPAETIKEFYPFDFKVLNKENLNSLIQNEDTDEKYVIYQIIPQTVTTRSGAGISQSAILYKSALFDVKSGRRMDLQKIKLSLAGSSGTNDLTKRELKKFAGQIN